MRTEYEWHPATLRVADIEPSHPVERWRRLHPRYADDPILVLRIGRGYRIHDGNARLKRARERGDRTIRAFIRGVRL